MLWWTDHTPQYTAIVATQAALHSLSDMAPTPAPPKPPLPNCPQCKGSGQIRTGDNQGWTACPCTERAACNCPATKGGACTCAICPDGKCSLKR
jgi:hypothetical protein